MVEFPRGHLPRKVVRRGAQRCSGGGIDGNIRISRADEVHERKQGLCRRNMRVTGGVLTESSRVKQSNAPALGRLMRAHAGRPVQGILAPPCNGDHHFPYWDCPGTDPHVPVSRHHSVLVAANVQVQVLYNYDCVLLVCTSTGHVGDISGSWRTMSSFATFPSFLECTERDRFISEDTSDTIERCLKHTPFGPRRDNDLSNHEGTQAMLEISALDRRIPREIY